MKHFFSKESIQILALKKKKCCSSKIRIRKNQLCVQRITYTWPSTLTNNLYPCMVNSLQLFTKKKGHQNFFWPARQQSYGRRCSTSGQPGVCATVILWHLQNFGLQIQKYRHTTKGVKSHSHSYFYLCSGLIVHAFRNRIRYDVSSRFISAFIWLPQICAAISLLC